MQTELDDPTPDERVLVISRRLKAPRQLVWRTFADPYHLAQWWGPQGYTNPVCELDFRVGGHWYNVMRSSDGRELPVNSQFIEIVPPERIVYRNAPPKGEVWQGNPPPSFVRTITFEEDDGHTVLTIRAEFDTTEDFQKARTRGFVEGTNSSIDKLADHLRSLQVPEG